MGGEGGRSWGLCAEDEVWVTHKQHKGVPGGSLGGSFLGGGGGGGLRLGIILPCTDIAMNTKVARMASSSVLKVIVIVTVHVGDGTVEARLCFQARRTTRADRMDRNRWLPYLMKHCLLIAERKEGCDEIYECIAQKVAFIQGNAASGRNLVAETWWLQGITLTLGNDAHEYLVNLRYRRYALW